jgi:hypothetical protein
LPKEDWYKLPKEFESKRLGYEEIGQVDDKR